MHTCFPKVRMGHLNVLGQGQQGKSIQKVCASCIHIRDMLFFVAANNNSPVLFLVTCFMATSVPAVVVPTGQCSSKATLSTHSKHTRGTTGRQPNQLDVKQHRVPAT